MDHISYAVIDFMHEADHQIKEKGVAILEQSRWPRMAEPDFRRDVLRYMTGAQDMNFNPPSSLNSSWTFSAYADKDATVEEKTPVKKVLRTFVIDHRSNPGLHELYVQWAYEELEIIRKTSTKLFNLNRFNSSMTASKLEDVIQTLVQGNSAYFEAAALLWARIDSPAEEETHDKA